jgi:hypothetical protein
MRVALFAMMFVNVAYFAWATWVEPAAPPVVYAGMKLPELRLAAETPANDATAIAVRQEPARCVSVGPFEDLAAVARAAATLKERGLATRQRAEQGTPLTSYWVYVGGLRSELEQTRVMRRLQKGKVSDASVMPAVDGGERRISVGLFSDRSGAERRSRAVDRLGLKTRIEEQSQTGAAYWIDFDLTARDSAVAAEGLLASDDRGSRIEIRVCPAADEEPPGPATQEAGRTESSPVRLGQSPFRPIRSHRLQWPARGRLSSVGRAPVL